MKSEVMTSDSTQQSRRSTALDLLRVLGIVAVIYGHIWTGGLTPRLIFSWHVPLFFFLSGYLWTSPRSFRVELSKRYATLVLPYFTWLLAMLIPFVIWMFATGRMPFEIIGKTFYGGVWGTRPFTAFWFVSALFFAVILYRLIDPLPRIAIWAIAAGGLVLAFFFGNALASTPLAIGSALPCIAFLLLGQEFHRLQAKIVSYRPLIGLLLLAAGALLVATKLAGTIDIKSGKFGTLFVGVIAACLICAGMLLIAEALTTRLPALLGNGITILASSGLAVVLAHSGVLKLLNTPPEGRKRDFVLAIVVPWLIGLAALWTPLSPFVNGSPWRRRKNLAS